MGPTWVLSAPGGPHEPCYMGYEVSKSTYNDICQQIMMNLYQSLCLLVVLQTIWGSHYVHQKNWPILFHITLALDILNIEPETKWMTHYNTLSECIFLRYSKLNIWLWKSKVKVMTHLKIDGHIKCRCCVAIEPFFRIWNIPPWILKFKVHKNNQNLIRSSTSKGHQSCQKWKRYEKLLGHGGCTVTHWPLGDFSLILGR